MILFITSVDVITLPRMMWMGLRDNIDPAIAAVSVVLIADHSRPVGANGPGSGANVTRSRRGMTGLGASRRLGINAGVPRSDGEGRFR